MKGSDKLSKTIISFDQAKEFAWAVIDKDSAKLIEYDMHKFKVKEDYDTFIYNAKILFAEHIKKHNPDLVTIEGIQYQSNQATYHKLSKLQGVLINYLIENDINYKIIMPSTWKNYLKVGQGNKTNRKMEKANAIQFVLDTFGLEVNDNIADAICMAYYTSKRVDI